MFELVLYRPPATFTPRPPVELPSDVLHKILRYCTAADVARCSMVCLHWRALASQDRVWAHLVWVDWKLSSSTFKPPRPRPKQLYVEMHSAFEGMFHAGNVSAFRDVVRR